ncbi:MAG: hypothetical protein MR283_07885 [Erysipelotrichaceae bacterium]|nr:hypothetical protein [Erysipelotrichaceae bacterium]
MATPVYLFTGFLDSGKTSLILDTLNDASFMEGNSRILILCLEQGEVAYNDKYLSARKAFVEYLDSPDQLTEEKIHELDTIYHPSQVFIEYNGTLPITDFILSKMPDYWPLVQILTTIDASTFEMYIGAMRSMIYEQIKYSDTIICNRCTPDTSASLLRGNIKAINKKTQIFYEGVHGAPVTLKEGTLPFDINAPLLDIKDDDYGIWYMDATENPDKYDGKEIILRGKFSETLPGYHQTFIMGRQAMVCCANDTSLCGLTVTGVKVEELQKDHWYQVQGNLKTIPLDNGGKTVVLYANRIENYQQPEDEFVYFS